MPDGRAVNVLYITYDGILEPLGQSQVVAYLDRLSAPPETRVFLLSYEKPGDAGDERARMRADLRRRGITWIPLRYHKRPTLPATLYDIAVGLVVATAIALRHRVRIVHARSYVAALIAVWLKRLVGARFLFDMRGFWADERVEAGLWPRHGRLYAMAKAFERVYLRNADAVVTLTEAAEREIRGFSYLQDRCPAIAVIPTCVDLERFDRPRAPRSVAAAREFTLVYSGSLGTWYRIDDMVALFVALKARHPRARFVVLSRSDPAAVEALRRRHGLADGDLTVRAVPHRQMPEWVGAGDAGIMFARSVWADKARCPTKLGEFLACGVPVVVSPGIGDTEAVIRREGVGVVVETFTPRGYEAAVDAMDALRADPELGDRCRRTAERHFAGGVRSYRALYGALAR
jgi:glycosyltransferase involved in cell wall biosynthesis